MNTDGKIESFDDLVEGQRKLEISVEAGMIKFQLSGGRDAAEDTFRLDSENLESFMAALYNAAARVRVHQPTAPSATEVLVHAVQTFGDANKAIRWLDLEQFAFDGEFPRKMLATPEGRIAVDNLLWRIEVGALA